MTIFKNTGKSIQEVENIKKNIKQSDASEDLPLGIRMPLEKSFSPNESLFKMNKDIKSQVSNNFKTFLLTKKGELLCKPDFGTSISSIYNRTDLTVDQIESIVMEEVNISVRKYFPFIQLLDFESKSITNNKEDSVDFFKVVIRYSIEGFENEINSMELTIRRSA
jgi:phage baseplate assembly protein W